MNFGNSIFEQINFSKNNSKEKAPDFFAIKNQNTACAKQFKNDYQWKFY